MKILNLIFLIALVSGCSRLRIKAENVHVEIVQKSSLSIDAARAKFLAHKCQFIKNITTPVPLGISEKDIRVIEAIRSKASAEGGNAVISSLLPSMEKEKTVVKGIIYFCPEDNAIDHV